jgi:hypothetical protein
MGNIRTVLTGVSVLIVLAACSTHDVDLGCEPDCMPEPILPMPGSSVLERVTPAWTHFCGVAGSPEEESTCRSGRIELIASCAERTGMPDIVVSAAELARVQQELHACVYGR